MLANVLPVPFADAARQRQYEAVRAALAAEVDAPPTVLLGNLAAFSPVAADALIVRPAGLALLVLTPRPGHLTLPALAYGTWQLDGRPLPGREGADNPFAQYQQQQPAALAWLAEQFDLPATMQPASLGLALFESPLTFGPEVEARLHQQSAAAAFDLLGEVTQLPARLRQQLDAGPALLAEDELLDWADYLAAGLPAAGEPAAALPGTSFVEQKLRQLWSWLGAEDIPADPPYGSPAPPDTYQRDQQEQARLEQLRQELLAELRQQRQEAATREAAREQELGLLRQQLAQAGQSAAERQAEQQAKAALEEAVRTARAELAGRNKELDTRIQQLEQLIRQLQASAVAPPLPGAARPGPAASVARPAQLKAAGAAQAPPAGRPAARSYRRLRQAERWGLVLLGVAIVGAGSVAVVRAVHPPAAHPRSTPLHRAAGEDSRPENELPPPVVIYDTVARAAAPPSDTAAGARATTAPAAVPTPATVLPADSSAPAKSSPSAPADSAAGDSPTP